MRKFWGYWGLLRTNISSEENFLQPNIKPLLKVRIQVPVAARSEAWVCGCSLAEIVTSNPTRSTDLCPLWMLSGRVLCDKLIIRPEESYRLWCVVVCDLETSWMRRLWPNGGCCAPPSPQKKKKGWVKMSHHAQWTLFPYAFSSDDPVVLFVRGWGVGVGYDCVWVVWKFRKFLPMRKEVRKGPRSASEVTRVILFFLQ